VRNEPRTQNDHITIIGLLLVVLGIAFVAVLSFSQGIGKPLLTPPSPVQEEVLSAPPQWLAPNAGATVARNFVVMAAGLPDPHEADVLRVVELVGGRAVTTLGEAPLAEGGPLVRPDYLVRCRAKHLGETTIVHRLYRAGAVAYQSQPLQVIVED